MHFDAALQGRYGTCEICLARARTPSCKLTGRMRKRTRYTLLAVVLLLCALAAALYLRMKAPPEAARLLPESDAIVYVNLKPLRASTHFDRNPVPPSPSLQQFTDATGIVPERDVDSAAFALHRMADPNGPNGTVAFSEVVEARFDRARLERYLAALAARLPNGSPAPDAGQEGYAGRTIYNIPSQGRMLRVAVLGYNTVVASNMPTPEQIHSMLDRHRAAASPFAGSSLLNDRYGDVPAFSVAWGIGHIGLPFAAPGSAQNHITLLGVELPLPADTTFVASVRYAGAVKLRVDQITPSEADAQQSVHQLNALLNLFRSLQQIQQPTARTPEDSAIRQFTDSIEIEQHRDRATLTATLPAEALKRLTNATP
jgi:hypothetical protein